MKSYARHFYTYSGAIVFLGAAIFMSAVPAATERIGEPEGRYRIKITQTGKLSLDSKNVALRTILSQMETKMNVKYTVPENHLNTPITITFQSLSLHHAIKRILHGISHVCILNSEGHVERIITFSDVNAHVQRPLSSQEPPDSHSAESDLILSGEPPVEPQNTLVAPMPPPKVMQALKEELSPVPPPDMNIR